MMGRSLFQAGVEFAFAAYVKKDGLCLLTRQGVFRQLIYRLRAGK